VPAPTPDRPCLDGPRVLNLIQSVAERRCTMLLADPDADVIEVAPRGAEVCSIGTTVIRSAPCSLFIQTRDARVRRYGTYLLMICLSVGFFHHQLAGVDHANQAVMGADVPALT
jgi:hypothetical protein